MRHHKILKLAPTKTYYLFKIPCSRIELIETYTPEVLQNIFDGSHVILDSRSNFDIYRASLNETHCKYNFEDFRQSRDIVISQNTNWILNKNSPFKETININLMWMHATGLGTIGNILVAVVNN